MDTDRRIYWTTAIVALVVGLAISFLARSDPLAYSGGVVLHEMQPVSATVDTVAIRTNASL